MKIYKEREFENVEQILEYLESLGNKFTIFISSSFSAWYVDAEGDRIIGPNIELPMSDIKKYLTTRSTGGKITNTLGVEKNLDGISYTKSMSLNGDRFRGTVTIKAK